MQNSTEVSTPPAPLILVEPPPPVPQSGSRRGSMSLDRKPTPNPAATGSVLPVLSLCESEEVLQLTCELPGIEPSDVHLVLPSDSQVQLYLEKRDHELGDRPLGRFSKAFQLPFGGLKREEIHTSYDPNGSYTITIKKPPSFRRVQVSDTVAPQINQ